MKHSAKNAWDKDKYFLTSNLGKKYQIGKAAISARLKALYINPLKQGKNFVINAEQLQVMDDLNTHLKAGGRMEEFVQQRIESGEIVPPQEPQGKAIVLIKPDAPVVSATPQPQQEVRDSLSQFNRAGAMVFVSGRLAIDDPEGLEFITDPNQFPIICATGNSITLEAAPLMTVNTILGEQFATGQLFIRSIYTQQQKADSNLNSDS